MFLIYDYILTKTLPNYEQLKNELNNIYNDEKKECCHMTYCSI